MNRTHVLQNNFFNEKRRSNDSDKNRDADSTGQTRNSYNSRDFSNRKTIDVDLDGKHDDHREPYQYKVRVSNEVGFRAHTFYICLEFSLPGGNPIILTFSYNI